jgi:NodT family efflux transporter outer membrane factor (OMF) lipoprotein
LIDKAAAGVESARRTMRSTPSLVGPGALLVLLLSLAGCVGAPELGPKPAPLTPQDVAADRSLAPSTAASWPGDSWWRTFGDSQLTGLIEEGLAHAPDVAAAAARLRRANGMAQETGAALLPTIDLQAEATAEKQSYNMGFPKEFVPKGWMDRGQAAANVGLDIDLWGRNRAALAAATSEARAAAVDAQQARLMLSTGIALAYCDLGRLFSERDNRQGALDLRIATQKLVAARMANGLETRGSLRQAEAEVAAAREALGATDQAIAVRRNQIAALIGAGPDRGLSVARPPLSARPPAGVPAGVTTALIGRRPDVVAARERVEAAASRIQVAHADFFPAIRLGALVGLQSLGIDQLFDSDSTFGSAGAAITLPIFHGGALKGRYRQARARYDEAVADYDRTVITAYQQVADAVTGQSYVGQRLNDARTALAASEEAYKIARLRYEGGLSNYLDVLAVEDRLLQARLSVASLSGFARTQDVTLIRALGGGFDSSSADRSDRNEPNG